MYDIEAIYEAESVSNAIELLQKYPYAVIIAGGNDVLIKIRKGKLTGSTLVSLQKLDELRGISIDHNNAIRIGSLTTFSHIAKNPIIQKYIPTLAEAAETIGSPQIRNIGTIGGSVCNSGCDVCNVCNICKSVSFSDCAPNLIAYSAIVEYCGPHGKRLVPIKEHYVSAGKTALETGEILQAIIIPKESYENYFGNYIKYSMRAVMDLAVLSCSANVSLSPDRKAIEKLRLAYGAANPVPIRALNAEKIAKGKNINTETISLIAKTTLNDIKPRSTFLATKDFRIHLVEELAKRVVTKSLKRAGVIL